MKIKKLAIIFFLLLSCVGLKGQNNFNTIIGLVKNYNKEDFPNLKIILKAEEEIKIKPFYDGSYYLKYPAENKTDSAYLYILPNKKGYTGYKEKIEYCYSELKLQHTLELFKGKGYNFGWFDYYLSKKILPDTISLKGTVSDYYGPVRNAYLQINNSKLQTSTDSLGRFMFILPESMKNKTLNLNASGNYETVFVKVPMNESKNIKIEIGGKYQPKNSSFNASKISKETKDIISRLDNLMKSGYICIYDFAREKYDLTKPNFGLNDLRTPSNMLKDIYQDFTLQTTKEELLEIMNHPSPMARVFAHNNLVEMNHPDVEKITIEHLTDNQEISSLCGCIGESKKVSELIYRKYRFKNKKNYITPKEPISHKLDSIIFYNDSIQNISIKSSILSRLELKPEYYETIRKYYISSKDLSALMNLAKYKNPNDVQLILKATNRKDLNYSEKTFLLLAIDNFKHIKFLTYLKNHLEELKSKGGYLSRIYDVLLGYNKPEVLTLLEEGVKLTSDYNMLSNIHYSSICHSLAKINSEYFNEKFNPKGYYKISGKIKLNINASPIYVSVDNDKKNKLYKAEVDSKSKRFVLFVPYDKFSELKTIKFFLYGFHNQIKEVPIGYFETNDVVDINVK